MPTPTIPGGQGFPPAPTIDSSTNCLMPFTPSAGTHILRKLMFSLPLPWNRCLLCRRICERVAQILRDVLQRPDVEIRGGILDRSLEIDGRDRTHEPTSGS